MKKVSAIILVVVATILLSSFIRNAFGQSGATLTMINKSPFEVDLYVSGEYKCTAKAESSCKTQVSIYVNHKLSARVDGEEVTSQYYNFQEGEVRKWTVGFKPN